MKILFFPLLSALCCTKREGEVPFYQRLLVVIECYDEPDQMHLCMNGVIGERFLGTLAWRKKAVQLEFLMYEPEPLLCSPPMGLQLCKCLIVYFVLVW